MPEPIKELNGLSVEYYCERVETIDVTEYVGHQHYYSTLCEATERLRDELESKLDVLCDSASEASTALFQDLVNLRSELVSLRDSASSNRDSISDIVGILTRLREDAVRLRAEDADWRANVDEDDATTLRSIRESVRAELQSKVLEADAVLWHRALTMSSPPPSALAPLDVEPRPGPVAETLPVPAGEAARPATAGRDAATPRSPAAAPRHPADREPVTAACEPTVPAASDVVRPAADEVASPQPGEPVCDIVEVDGLDVEVTIELAGEMLKLSDIEAVPRHRGRSGGTGTTSPG